MKKKNFVSLILGTAGGILFALGMCMCMTMIWTDLMIQGIIVGIIGIVLLLCLIPICKGFKD